MADILIRLLGQNADLRSALRQANAEIERTEKEFDDSFGAISDRARRTGLAIGAAAVATTAAAFAIGRNLFQVGQEAAAGSARFALVFEESQDQLRGFIAEFEQVAGVTTGEVEDMLTAVAAYAQGVGFAEAESARFSQQVVQLAGDVASFNSIPTEDALQRILSGMVGNTEATRELNIVFQRAEVTTQALANTGKESVESLTQQEIAIAALQVITQRAAPQIGNLAATIDELDNQAKIAFGSLRDMREEIATELLPNFLLITDTILENKESIEELARTVATAIPRMIELFTKLADAVILVGESEDRLKLFGGTAAGATTGAIIGSVIPGIGTAAGAVIGGLTGAAGAGIDKIQDDIHARAEERARQAGEDALRAWQEGMVELARREAAAGQDARADALIRLTFGLPSAEEAEAGEDAGAALAADTGDGEDPFEALADRARALVDLAEAREETGARMVQTARELETVEERLNRILQERNDLTVEQETALRRALNDVEERLEVERQVTAEFRAQREELRGVQALQLPRVARTAISPVGAQITGVELLREAMDRVFPQDTVRRNELAARLADVFRDPSLQLRLFGVPEDVASQLAETIGAEDFAALVETMESLRVEQEELSAASAALQTAVQQTTEALVDFGFELGTAIREGEANLVESLEGLGEAVFRSIGSTLAARGAQEAAQAIPPDLLNLTGFAGGIAGIGLGFAASAIGGLLFGGGDEQEENVFRGTLRALREAREEEILDVVIVFPPGVIDPFNPQWQEAVLETVEDLAGNRRGRVRFQER